MDFDLFNLGDDDEILSNVIEPTQQTSENLCYDDVPEFQCTGEDSQLHAQFSPEGFIRSGFLGVDKVLPKMQAADEIMISPYEFQAVHLRGPAVSQYVISESCIHIQHLHSSVNGQAVGDHDSTLSFYQRRRQVTMLLHLLLQNTHPVQWQLLRAPMTNLRTLINRITEHDNWKLLYFANSSKGNECNVPAYHLLHGVLEWKWLDLCILYKYEWAGGESEQRKGDSPFMQQLRRVFSDLLLCALRLYRKRHSAELLQRSPFPCTCFRELWLLLQLALERWDIVASDTDEQQTFWLLFNNAANDLKLKMTKYSLNTLQYYEFINWMLHAMVQLHGYRSNGLFDGAQQKRARADEAENYDFCQQNTRCFLAANPSEQQLRVYIGLLTPTLLQWWRANVAVPILLWEHYHKRLNTTFYVPGAAPNQLAVSCSGGKAYLDRYRALMQQGTSSSALADAQLSSYTHFTRLLGHTLQRLCRAQSKHQAQQLLGRIYSKFSQQKFLALNETGLHHLNELFIVLALSGDSELQLLPKLRDKLLTIAYEKLTPARRLVVARGHMALLLLGNEQRCELSVAYVRQLLQQLQNVRNELALCRVYAEALNEIQLYDRDEGKGEQLLIDAWLPHYLQNCTSVEQERTLQALHGLFAKSTELTMPTALLHALHSHVLPLLKQVYQNAYSIWLPQLAADFCIAAVAHKTSSTFQQLCTHFVTTTTNNRHALPQFLLQLHASPITRSLLDAHTCMQAWLRSLVLLSAQDIHVQQLTQLVVKLPIYAELTQLLDSPVDAAALLNSKEPLCTFVAAVGARYDACVHARNHTERRHIADTFNAYLRNFERWLPAEQLFTAIASTATSTTTNDALPLRFYSFLAIIVYHCAPIVYVKSQITCFFHIAMTRYILPANVQLGRTPEPRLAQLVHKVWPVLVQGIGRLNYRSDAYVTKTLNDLIQRWMPHFKFTNNPRLVARPYISCLLSEQHQLAQYVFEQLTAMFLATQRRQADVNACLVITIYQQVVAANETTTTVAGSTTPTTGPTTAPTTNSLSSTSSNITSLVSTNATNSCVNLASSVATFTSPTATDIRADVDPTLKLQQQRLETFMRATCLLTLEHIMMVDELVPSRGMLLEHYRHLLTGNVYKSAPHLQQLLADYLRHLAKKHLAYYTHFYFELLTKLVPLSPSLISDIMDFLTDELLVVEQKRGAGEDKNMRACMQKLKLSLEDVQRKRGALTVYKSGSTSTYK